MDEPLPVILPYRPPAPPPASPVQILVYPIEPASAPRTLRVEVWPSTGGGLSLAVPGCDGYCLRVFLLPG